MGFEDFGPRGAVCGWGEVEIHGLEAVLTVDRVGEDSGTGWAGADAMHILRVV